MCILALLVKSATRHSASVKTILCLPLLFAPYVMADEAADRAGIDRAIAWLNELPRRSGLFTEDANASAELERLPRVAAPTFRMPAGTAGDPRSLPRTDPPTVSISHEPWGEAAIHLPGMAPVPVIEIMNPRISSGAIRFITPDVALAEATWTYKSNDATTQTVPLLFVMKKEEDSWKIASLRMLAPR
jgi:hypothetical protein